MYCLSALASRSPVARRRTRWSALSEQTAGWTTRRRRVPFHEPTHPQPLPGGEQASVRVLSVPLLGGARGGFMVPMHARKRKEALHEPRVKAGAPVLRSSATAEGGSSTHSKRCRAVAERLGLREAFGGRPACRRLPQFMVPMHAQERKEAFRESTNPPTGKSRVGVAASR